MRRTLLTLALLSPILCGPASASKSPVHVMRGPSGQGDPPALLCEFQKQILLYPLSAPTPARSATDMAPLNLCDMQMNSSRRAYGH